MDDQRLHAEFRRAADGRLGPRGPLRAPADAGGRADAVHRGVRGVRAGAEPGLADRCAGRAGGRAAAAMPVALALLSAAFGPEQRARALGVFAAITGLATVGGPLVGGAIVQSLSWQWIFWLNLPIGAVLMPLVRMRLGESDRVARKFDPSGDGLVSVVELGLMWGVISGNESG